MLIPANCAGWRTHHALAAGLPNVLTPTAGFRALLHVLMHFSIARAERRRTDRYSTNFTRDNSRHKSVIRGPCRDTPGGARKPIFEHAATPEGRSGFRGRQRAARPNGARPQLTQHAQTSTERHIGLAVRVYVHPSHDRCLGQVMGQELLRSDIDERPRSWGEEAVNAPDWHDELVLVAELASVNNQIARFVLRLLDADAGRKEHVAVADECHLGGRLVDLGYALQDRAVHRAAGPTDDAASIVGSDLRPRPLPLEGLLNRSRCVNH